MTENSVKSNKKRRSTLVLVLLPLIVFAGLVGLFFSSFVLRDAGLISEPSQVPSVLIDQPAPEFNLPVLSDSKQEISETEFFSDKDLHGKVSVVNIWASWCVPCRAEHPILMELARDDRVQVFGLNYKDKSKNALEFLKELGNPFKTIGFDKSGRVGIDWGVYGVPETYIVGSDGIIRFKFIGPLTLESYESTFLPNLEKIIAEI